jgi:hypothetical protein
MYVLFFLNASLYHMSSRSRYSRLTINSAPLKPAKPKHVTLHRELCTQKAHIIQLQRQMAPNKYGC